MVLPRPSAARLSQTARLRVRQAVRGQAARGQATRGRAARGQAAAKATVKAAAGSAGLNSDNSDSEGSSSSSTSTSQTDQLNFPVMFLDAAPTFSNPCYFSRQTGTLVAALEVETRQLCQQPLLFLWAPGRLYRDAAFATKPGEEGPWKELDYDLMGLRDEEAPEPRVSRVVR